MVARRFSNPCGCPSMRIMPVIKLQNACVEHQGQPILVNANLEINQGEFVYLIGQTEAEKRAILRLIIFAELPSAGAVSVGEYDSRQIRKADIPLVATASGRGISRLQTIAPSHSV